MKESIVTRGWDYFEVVLLIFISMCSELIYGLLIEPIIYGRSIEVWTTNQRIIHWIITCVSWGGLLYFILKYTKRNLNFIIRSNNNSIEMWRWGIIIGWIIICTMISYISWNGFKPAKEFINLGLIPFIFQYVYYFVETCMITGIIVFGQLAFEKWFKNNEIPYGGIICALTWGIGHLVTKGDVLTGVLSILSGFVFGTSYLLLKRDTIKTVLILFLMFVL